MMKNWSQDICGDMTGTASAVPVTTSKDSNKVESPIFETYIESLALY